MLSVELRKQLRDYELEVAFEVAPARCHVLIGPTACGKTMTLRMIAGLEQPDAGRVVLNGRPLFDAARGVALPPERRSVGFVFQSYALFPHLSIVDNVAYGLRARGRGAREARARAREILERVHLQGLEQERPGRLSGGQQQRVAVARAIAGSAEVLLLDEPMAALDTQTRRRMRDELKSVIDGLDVATVVVTHDPVDALTLGQVISVMQEGRLCQTDTRQELLARPRNEYVAEFLGLNLLRGEAHTDASGLTEVRCGEQRFYSLHPASGPVFLTCHPSDIILSRERPEGSALNVLRGRVVSLSRLGAATRVALLPQGSSTTNGSTLVAEISHLSEQELSLHEQDEVYAAFKASATEVYS